ncbi:hypothetical protein NIES4073_11690 [Kalymmatonema gypsitolerans NIES-4073]|nr:hypothetical protein NIES4073_11690 [Scytonema sp. NIES-4073]
MHIGGLLCWLIPFHFKVDTNRQQLCWEKELETNYLCQTFREMVLRAALPLQGHFQVEPANEIKDRVLASVDTNGANPTPQDG